jgi:ribulose kinase
MTVINPGIVVVPFTIVDFVTILSNRSQLFVQTHSDVLGLSVILPKEAESVLLGAAMLAAAASEKAKPTAEVSV